MKRILATEERMERAGVICLLGAAVAFFLWHFVEMIDVTGHDLLLQYFPMVWAAMAAALTCRGKTWQRKSVWLLALGLGWIFLRMMLGGLKGMNGGYKAIMNGVWAFGICYQLAFGFKEKSLLTFLRWLIGLWTLAETLLAAAGVVLALYDQQMYSMHGLTMLGMAAYNRLELLTYCTNSASTLVVSMTAALVGIGLTRNCLGKLMYIVAMLVMAVALSLTVTRTAFITLGLALGLVAGCAALVWLRKNGRLREGLIRCVCVALVLVMVVGTYLALNKTIDLFNAAKISVRASAETEESTVKPVSQRPLSGQDSLLSNREDVWLAALKLLAQKPIYLLIGTSVVDPMAEVNPLTGMHFDYVHLHSIYLQVLLECGIPGFLIMILFLWQFARAALKLLLAKDVPMWQRLLPVLPITVLVAETVESLTLLSTNWPALPMMMLFMGLTMRYAQDERDLLIKE